MLSRLLGVVCVVLVVASPSPAIEVGVKLQKIDVEGRMATIKSNGQVRVLRFADDAQVLDENGKDLIGGLSAEELKADAIVTLRVEPVGSAMVIQSLRLGGKLSQQNQNAQGKPSVGRMKEPLLYAG